MSNNFPAVPGSFLLSSLKYDVGFGFSLPNVMTIPSGDIVTYPATWVTFPYANNQILTPQFTIQFSPSGTISAFDQTTEQAAINTLTNSYLTVAVNLVNQNPSNYGGVPVTLANLQAQTTVTRTWTWTDPTGAFTLTHIEPSLPFPLT